MSDEDFKLGFDDTAAGPNEAQFDLQGMLLTIAATGALIAPMAWGGPSGIVISVAMLIAGFAYGRSGWLGLVGAILIFVVLTFIALGARGATMSARRSHSANNIRQMAIAIHDYHDKHRALPPRFSVDENGKPLHSWRVLILPFLGEQELYDQIDLTKPWSAPENLKFHNQMPEVFSCPNLPKKMGHTVTPYVAIGGANTAWPDGGGLNLNQISKSDGTSQTIALIEASIVATNWMAPFDIHLGQLDLLFQNCDNELSNFEGRYTGCNVVMCDASTLFFSRVDQLEMLRAMATRNGGEDISELNPF